MLRSIIENYLSSIREIQFFHPFIHLIDILGYYDIHLTHGSNEFGKDIIAKKDNDQYIFVVKVGDIDAIKYRNEVKGQIFESQTNSLSHPSLVHPPKKIYLVSTGKISSNVELSLQDHNSYSKKNKLPLVDLWDKDFLLDKFTKSGIDSFFNLHKNPEFISDFFETHTKIIKDELFQSFDIEQTTRKWLLLDLSNNINKLQVFFEAYYFSKLLIQRNRNYEALLFIMSLVRTLSSKNLLTGNAEILKSYMLEIVDSSHFLANTEDQKEKLNQSEGFFDILHYPERCLELAELLSLGILLENKKSNLKFFLICINEKGCYRPLSDNYAVSVFLISLAMIKLNLNDELRKYIINCTVWICDRYEKIGVAPIGSNKETEYEQLLSEYLSGLKNNENKFSFLATILLDICYFLEDDLLFEQVANEFRSVEIAPIYYHLNNSDNIWNYYDISSEHDIEFSTYRTLDYTSMSKKYYKNNSIVENLSVLELLSSIFLLRDRYYPSLIFEKILSN